MREGRARGASEPALGARHLIIGLGAVGVRVITVGRARRGSGVEAVVHPPREVRHGTHGQDQRTSRGRDGRVAHRVRPRLWGCRAVTRSAGLAACVALSVTAAVATSGYVAGRSRAPTRAEARETARDARASFNREAAAAARMGSQHHGLVAGLRTGRRTGKTRGGRSGAVAEPPAPTVTSDPCAPGDGHGDNNAPGSFISAGAQTAQV